MVQPMDLKAIERKAFRSTYEDGLWDICWGIWFFSWAFIPLIEYFGISRFWGYPLLFVPAVLITLGKRHLTAPRLGNAKFGHQREARRVKLMLWIGAIVALTWILFFVTMTGSVGKGILSEDKLLSPFVMGFLMTVLLGIVAYYMDYIRLYIYALFFGLGIPAAKIINERVGEPLDDLIAFGIPAIGILLVGLVLLLRFMKKYPKPTVEVGDGCYGK